MIFICSICFKNCSKIGVSFKMSSLLLVLLFLMVGGGGGGKRRRSSAQQPAEDVGNEYVPREESETESTDWEALAPEVLSKKKGKEKAKEPAGQGKGKGKLPSTRGKKKLVELRFMNRLPTLHAEVFHKKHQLIRNGMPCIHQNSVLVSMLLAFKTWLNTCPLLKLFLTTAIFMRYAIFPNRPVIV